MTVVETLTSADGTRRIQIYQRSTGTFGFREQIWVEHEADWMAGGRYRDSISRTIEAAVAKARAKVAWLAHESASELDK